jgi:urea transporter
MLFFSKNRFFSILILFVSFFSPTIGYAGLLSVVISVITGYLLGFDKFQLKTGLYSYSALLFGLGFANNFEIGLAFYLL